MSANIRTKFANLRTFKLPKPDISDFNTQSISDLIKLLRFTKISYCWGRNPNLQAKTRYADLKNAFPALCKIARVENFRFHDLRHTAATRMVNAGVDVVQVKNILGHADIRTTMRYAHAITEQSLDAMETLSNYAEKNRKIIEFKANTSI